jgi:hypothetical protein
MSARRLLVFGGIALIIAGLIFGDLFAVFVLHQNNARIGEQFGAATQAVAAGDRAAVLEHFGRIGRLLENRGTKVDTHVHIIEFGYLALLMALVLPYVALSEMWKKRLAKIFLTGAVMLPVCVFLIYYVGLTWSPLSSIGWASIFADFGGFLVIVACAGFLAGIWRYLKGERRVDDALLADRSWSSRMLLAGGTLLILAGFLHGGYYAAVDLYPQAAKEAELLREIADRSAAQDMTAVNAALSSYGGLQADKAVKIAAHSHIIKFGLLAMFLAFLQPYVFLSEKWKRRWVLVLLAGSVVLPVFVQAELWWGLVAGGIADTGGLLVIIALTGMLVGVFRYSGALDASGANA